MTEFFRGGEQDKSANTGDVNYLQAQGNGSQEHAAATDGNVIIPILQIGRPAVNNDRTPVPANWNLVNIYQNSQDGIVKISGHKYGQDQYGRTTIENVTGSGFFVTEDGKIATDYHVVQGLTGITVQTADGRTYTARIEDVQRDVDQTHDLAIIKVDASPMQRFRALPLGDPGLQVNDGVVAIGYPRGWQDMYASPGVLRGTQPLSRVVRPDAIGPGEDANRTVLDSNIHVEPGNSGGPLLSKEGKVIGIIATTDAKPNPNNDSLSVPGSSAESTPVQDLLALLNRSGRYQPANPIQTAGTLGLDQAPPYYQRTPDYSPTPYYSATPAAPAVQAGRYNFNLGGVTNFRRSLIGMYGSYGGNTITATNFWLTGNDVSTQTLPSGALSLGLQSRRGFFGNLRLPSS